MTSTGKKLNYAENLVGRRMPKRPALRIEMLAGFVKDDGTFCGRGAPFGYMDRHLVPVHKRLRSEGIIRMGMDLGDIGKIYYLREGEGPAKAALEARAQVDLYRRELKEWHEEFIKARKALREGDQPDIGMP